MLKLEIDQQINQLTTAQKPSDKESSFKYTLAPLCILTWHIRLWHLNWLGHYTILFKIKCLGGNSSIICPEPPQYHNREEGSEIHSFPGPLFNNGYRQLRQLNTLQRSNTVNCGHAAKHVLPAEYYAVTARNFSWYYMYEYIYMQQSYL